MNKKRVVHKKKASRSSPRKRASGESSLSYSRIFIITSCVLLLLAVFAVFNKGNVTQSVAGVGIARGLFNQAVVTLPAIYEASSYNIYYKQTSDSSYTNAVRDIAPNISQYTVSYLKKGTQYQYKISAKDASGEEFWWSEEQPLDNLESM